MRRLKRDVISGFCISAHKAQRLKPEPESTHGKRDPLHVWEDAGLGSQVGSEYSWSCEGKPGDQVRDIRGRFCALGEGTDSKGSLTLGFHGLRVGILPLFPPVGVQN